MLTEAEHIKAAWDAINHNPVRTHEGSKYRERREAAARRSATYNRRRKIFGRRDKHITERRQS